MEYLVKYFYQIHLGVMLLAIACIVSAVTGGEISGLFVALAFAAATGGLFAVRTKVIRQTMEATFNELWSSLPVSQLEVIPQPSAPSPDGAPDGSPDALTESPSQGIPSSDTSAPDGSTSGSSSSSPDAPSDVWARVLRVQISDEKVAIFRYQMLSRTAVAANGKKKSRGVEFSDITVIDIRDDAAEARPYAQKYLRAPNPWLKRQPAIPDAVYLERPFLNLGADDWREFVKKQKFLTDPYRQFLMGHDVEDAVTTAFSLSMSGVYVGKSVVRFLFPGNFAVVAQVRECLEAAKHLSKARDAFLKAYGPHALNTGDVSPAEFADPDASRGPNGMGAQDARRRKKAKARRMAGGDEG